MGFGIGIINGKTSQNTGILWRSAYLYDAQFIFTVGFRYKYQPTDTTKTFRSIPLFEWNELHIPEKFVPIIIEKTENSKNIWNFHHPQNAIYILGAEDKGIPRELIKNNWCTIHIPSEQPYSMNVAMAGSLVMAHRYNQFKK